MSITVEEINSVKFDHGRNKDNYDYRQVDSFLDRIAGEIDNYNAAIAQLNTRCEELEKQLASYKEKEEAINHTLIEAGALRASMLKRAEDDAKNKADAMAEQLKAENKKLEDIKAEQDAAVKRIRYILESQMSNLDFLLNNCADNTDSENN